MRKPIRDMCDITLANKSDLVPLKHILYEGGGSISLYSFKSDTSDIAWSRCEQVDRWIGFPLPLLSRQELSKRF